jgi:hypothetical protein
MRLLPRSNKKRIAKKWFKRNGYVKCVLIGKYNGQFWHKVKYDFFAPIAHLVCVNNNKIV